MSGDGGLDERDATAAAIRERAALYLLERAEHGAGDRQADLDAAIRHLEVLAAAASGRARRLDLVALLSMACWERIGGDMSQHDQVDRLVRYAREAWELLEPGTEDWLLAGAYLAVGRYEQLRRPPGGREPPGGRDRRTADVVIRVLTEMEQPLAGNPDARRQAAVLLGLCLAGRARQAGRTADLTSAGPYLRRAAAALPAGATGDSGDPGDSGAAGDSGDPGWPEATQALAAAVSALADIRP